MKNAVDLDPVYLDILSRTEINYPPRARLDKATSQIIGRAIWRSLHPLRGDDAYFTKDRPWEKGIRALGYLSTEALMRRLEAQFTPHPYTGEMMSWSNYRTLWTLGHKKPPFYFTYETRTNPGYRANWCISNLKPVFMDSLGKGIARERRSQREKAGIPLAALDPKSFPRYL